MSHTLIQEMMFFTVALERAVTAKIITPFIAQRRVIRMAEFLRQRQYNAMEDWMEREVRRYALRAKRMK